MLTFVLLTVIVNYCHSASINSIGEVNRVSRDVQMSAAERQKICNDAFLLAEPSSMKTSCWGSMCMQCLKNPRCCRKAWFVKKILFSFFQCDLFFCLIFIDICLFLVKIFRKAKLFKIYILTLHDMHPEWQGGLLIPAPIKTHSEAFLNQFFHITWIGGQK